MQERNLLLLWIISAWEPVNPRTVQRHNPGVCGRSFRSGKGFLRH